MYPSNGLPPKKNGEMDAQKLRLIFTAHNEKGNNGNLDRNASIRQKQNLNKGCNGSFPGMLKDPHWMQIDYETCHSLDTSQHKLQMRREINWGICEDETIIVTG